MTRLIQEPAERWAAQLLFWLEPVVLALLLYAFWFTDINRVWTLALLVPLVVLRLAAYGRAATRLPILALFAALLALGLVNIYAAPYSWGTANLNLPALGIRVALPYGWVMLGRPLLGMALFLSLVERGRSHGLRGVAAISVAVALLVAFMALVSTQWNSKSDPLSFLIDRLPVITTLPITQGGFNANEIAGALAWLTPLAAGLALVRWRPRALQLAAAIGFALLLLALFLGQSRMALGGVIMALGGLIVVGIPRGRRRWAALAALAAFVLLQGALMANLFRSPTDVARLEQRDEVTTTHRLAMWQAALNIVRDYPLTGVGMNLYRNGDVRAVYPVPTYEQRVLPHAHNEYLQVAADLGLPGVAAYLGLYAAAGWMVFRTWRRGLEPERTVALAAGAGLLAHALYGLADAVALWDRFAFLWWWLLGVAGAAYVQVTARARPERMAGPDSAPTAERGARAGASRRASG